MARIHFRKGNHVRSKMKYRTGNFQRTYFGLKLMLCTMLPLLVAVILGSFKSPKENAGSMESLMREGIGPGRDNRNRELAILIPGLL